MNIQPVQLGNRQLELPIIQGGMGVGISLSSLAGAVMKEGAMGVISAAHPGYRKKDFWNNSCLCNVEALHEEVQKAKAIAQGKGLCGVNIMVASKDYDTYVKAAVEAGADAIISGAGIPMKLPELVGDADILLAPIVSSGKTARLICKAWMRHSHRLPDFIVIEGSEAGGHLGFTKEQLQQHTCASLCEILKDVQQEIASYEEEHQKKIPIFVAGGIYDGYQIAEMLALGASGVQMGTRFIATHECDADLAFKQMFVHAKQEDIALVSSPAGLPGRAILTDFMKEAALHKIPVHHCIQCMKPCNPADTPYCISKALIEAVQGNVQKGLVFSGSNGYRIQEIISVHELIQELKQQWEEA